MKINKSKSPFVGGADAPDEKDIAKAVKGEKFSDALHALETGTTAPNQLANRTRETLVQIARQNDFNNEEETAAALRQSAEVLVKSRLSEKFQQSEQSAKVIGDLSDFVSDDPLLKGKLLSVLKKLRGDGADA